MPKLPALDLPAGVVFDLDGTLLETERLSRRCFVLAMEEIGWEVDMAIYDKCVGGTFESTERILREGYGDDFPYERMNEHWSAHYHGYLEERAVDTKPGVVELLELFTDSGIPVGLATSSRRPTVEQKLRMAQLADYFHATVCGGETEVGKPAPDPYLKAIRDLGVDPAATWAIEDSDNGVWAAHRAGMTVFQIPDELQPSAEVRALGHEILESAELILERLR